MHHLGSGLHVSGPPSSAAAAAAARAPPPLRGILVALVLDRPVHRRRRPPLRRPRPHVPPPPISAPRRRRPPPPVSRSPASSSAPLAPRRRRSRAPRIHRPRRRRASSLGGLRSGAAFWWLPPSPPESGSGCWSSVLVSARRPEVLAAASAVAAAVGVVGVWNWLSRARAAERFFRRFPDSSVGRGGLPVGELVKISGQVTCGRVPLVTSYQDVSRCIFTSSELYEYRGWSGAPANPNHRRFTWGLRHSERNVVNFYISDHGSGTRFLVRAGDGAKVTHFVKSKTIDINKGNRELTPNFISWLADNNLSIGDQLLRLKEGFIKEGDTASVVGILRRGHTYDIIDPPHVKVSTGCRWTRCLFPVLVEGLILIGDENPEDEFVYLA